MVSVLTAVHRNIEEHGGTEVIIILLIATNLAAAIRFAVVRTLTATTTELDHKAFFSFKVSHVEPHEVR